jgi:hypothetical protein
MRPECVETARATSEDETAPVSAIISSWSDSISRTSERAVSAATALRSSRMRMRPPIHAMRTAKKRLTNQRTTASLSSKTSEPRGASRAKSATVQDSAIATADGPKPPYHEVIATAAMSGA